MSLKSFLQKNKISSVWIVPIITILIALWLLISYLYEKGVEITLISQDASGIVAGKTMIKNRNVNIGMVSSVSLSPDFEQVIIKATIDRDMDNLIRDDSVFSLVQPRIGIGGVSGLETLFSGVYIELFAGKEEKLTKKKFELYDMPPLSTALEEGLILQLESQQSDVIPIGSAILFRGYQVGQITHSKLNLKTREMEYRVNIEKPFDSLITSNVRFWKEGSVDLAFTPNGATLSVPPLDVLLSGGISFDVPDDAPLGNAVEQGSVFKLYETKEEIQNSQYTQSHYFLLFFDESISGLVEGSPVQYRGIQLGIVDKAPFFSKKLLNSISILNYEIPVLIKIQPQRITNITGESVNVSDLLIKEQAHGLRASLKSSNLLTNALYVDLDFYPETAGKSVEYTQKYGYDTIPTVQTGLAQIQNKIMQFLSTINEMPLMQLSQELNATLKQTKEMMTSLNKLVSQADKQQLPTHLNETLKSLNQTLSALQPGSELYNQLQNDSQKFDQVMNEVQKLLNTLNEKSNALIVPVKSQPDRIPKAKGK